MPNWGDVQNEINQQIAIHQMGAQQSFDQVRKKYLELLHQRTKGRNIIAYYSGWLSKPPMIGLEINDEDKNGFMMAVHKLDRTKGLDLILHTPGGDIASTQSIVVYLQNMFQHNIRAIVPQIAMSAGTVIACSCKEILMGKQSNLGPIDPQVRGVPAYGVIREFNRAIREIKKDPARVAVWQTIIGKYQPTFLGQCSNAIQWSNDFVREQLAKEMFADDINAHRKATKIAKELADYRKHKTHSRHIHADECKKMGLKVIEIESDQTLQDLILTVHHCYMYVLMNTGAFKIIENHMGVKLVKQQSMVAAPVGAAPLQPRQEVTEPAGQAHLHHAGI
ncbi:MAG: S49 family peptidase [Phycisphaerae bacterium]|nr:S49 family peptidase [Phycisphaerae bacterium]